MDRNREAFRKRFLAYKDGKSVGEIYGIPKFEDGLSGKVDWNRWDNAETTPYTIPFIKDKAITLTNAGRATGARLSTNLLDSLADNAMRAGVPVRTAVGLATKESTLGNPTDDKTAWNQSSAIRKLFNGQYPGTWLHINRGENIYGNSLINYYKGNLHPGGMKKSTIQQGIEFYKQHPDKYNPGQPGYQKAVEARGNEVMESPEVLKWYKEWETKQVKVMRPKPYSLPTIQSTAPKKFGKYADGKLPKYGNGKPKGDGLRYLWDDQSLSWDRITDSDVANAMAEWAFTPTTTRAKFDYENTPNPVKPIQKNAVISQDDNAWTKQRVVEESNKRTWLSDAADVSHAIGEGAMLASNFAAPEIEPLVYPTYNAFKTAASSVFRQMFSPRPKLEYIDFSAIAQAAAKMKADDAAWNLAHPEMLLGYKPKLPDVYDSTLERMKPHLSPAEITRANIITEPSKNPTVRQIDGFMERFAKMHNDYTDDVKSVYETLILPRRARAYSAELQTDGVIKINKYLEEAAKDNIDFSTREGLLIAADHGWTFDEIADYNNYRAYVDELNKYKTGSWLEYDDSAWSMRYPKNKETGGLVVGDYDINKNRIRTLGDRPLLHESRHRMDNYMPLLDREKKALQDAYGHLPNDSEGFFINRDELVTTNTELRDALLKRLNADKMSLKTQQKILNSSTQLSDEDILGELEFVNSYGSKIVSSIRKKLEGYEAALGRTSLPKEERVRRLAEKKTEYVDNIRHALMYVGGGALAIKPITKQITE